MSKRLQGLNLSDFKSQLQTDFSIDLDDGSTYVLELAEVSVVGDTDRNLAKHGRESFALILRNANTEQYLPQGMYTVQHATLGELPLFLVPIGIQDDHMRYEIVFS